MNIKELKEKFPEKYPSDFIRLEDIPGGNTNYTIRSLYQISDEVRSFKTYLDGEDESINFNIYEKSLNTLAEISSVISSHAEQFKNYKNTPISTSRIEIGSFINNVSNNLRGQFNSDSERDFNSAFKLTKDNLNTVFSIIQQAIAGSKILNQKSKIEDVSEQAERIKSVVTEVTDVVEGRKNLDLSTELEKRITVYTFISVVLLTISVITIFLFIFCQNNFTEKILVLVCDYYKECDKDIFLTLKITSLVPIYFLITLLVISFKSFEIQRRKFEKRKLIYTVIGDTKMQAKDINERDKFQSELLRKLLSEDDFFFEENKENKEN